LLAPDLIRLTQEEEAPAEDVSKADSEGKDEEMIALAFGSLIKTGAGRTRYLGPSAASSWLFEVNTTASRNGSNTNTIHYTQSSQGGPLTYEEFPALASTLSFIWPTATTGLRSQIETHLPSSNVLRAMVNSYFRNSLSL
jgi:hypothetical protein